MIPKNPCGFIDNNCNGGPVRAEVSHLQSLKEGVRNKFLRPLIRFNTIYTLLSLLKPYTFRNPKPITKVTALKGSYVKYL